MKGILIVDKEKNCTSFDVVYKLRKILNEKIGHTGTLDPMASGVLPLLIGDATKISKYLIEHDKIYTATITLGRRTDTLDSEGKVLEEKEVNLSNLGEENVRSVLNKFIGEQPQMPPMYSAIKVNGKKLYEYARKGETVEIKPRRIEIYSIELNKIDIENKQIYITVHSSKGTYIRSLCADISNALRRNSDI